ncbi:MAG: hypothetical protein HGB12_12700 [Bacteroidetes bacterium]|jgi:hypothetical protein|nr:hypothetical protein [Bacteroidota bacterium]
MEKKCSYCEWYCTFSVLEFSNKTPHKVEKNECRKAIPQIYAYVGNKKLSGWPEVHCDHWCGEFKAIEVI